jgi:aminotransferase
VPQLSRVTTEAEEAMSIKYNTMVYDLQRRGHKVLVMSLGEAFFDIPLLPMDVLPYPAVNHYSHSRGAYELREKLCGYHQSEYGVGIDPDREIIVTAGSKAAIHMTLMSILNPGDEVVYPEPGWVSYPEQIKLCYGIPVGVPHGKSIQELGTYVTSRTKAIIINNPHNPRGYVYSEAELAEILSIARQHDIWLLCDEAYSDFLIDGSFTSLAKLDPEKNHAVVFNSMSKNYGISGWRIGYVIGQAGLMDNVLKVNQHLITCPATILQHYLSRYFTDLLEITKPQIRDLICSRLRIQKYMDEIGLHFLPGAATFYFFVSIDPSRLGSEEFCTKLLEEEHISVVPGIGYGPSCDRFIRASIGTATLQDNMHGLDRVKELIDRTS